MYSNNQTITRFAHTNYMLIYYLVVVFKNNWGLKVHLYVPCKWSVITIWIDSIN